MRFFSLKSVIALTMVAVISTISMAQTYEAAVVEDAPLVYWRFSEDLSDTMGNLDLNQADSPVFVDSPLPDSQAYSSNEGKAWAAGFGTVDLNGLEDFSYEMWINLTGDNEGKYILQRIGLIEEGSDLSGGENSLIYQNGNLEFFTSRSDELEVPAVVELPNQTDEWHHVAMTYNYDDATLTFYVDGEEAYRDEFALLNPFYGGNSDELYIGATRNNPEGNVINGYLDEVAIYGKTLTAEEVASHYQASTAETYASAVQEDEPISYWRFEDNFEDTMGKYNLIPSGVSYTEGPQGSPNTALFGRVTNNQAEILYDMDAFTYELWFNPIFESSSSYILYRQVSASQHAVIYAYNPNALEFFSAFDANDQQVRPLVEIPNNTDQWYYCVVVNDVDASEMRIYIDGELTLQSEDVWARSGDGDEVVVGGSDNGDNFNGYIDEVAIYDYVLSEDRIQAHFNADMNPTLIDSWSIY